MRALTGFGCVVAALVFVGCGGGATGTPVDSGTSADAGSNDAGAKNDAGTPGSDAGLSDAGSSGTDAGSTTVDAGPPTPIVAPNETWTWVDFPESTCANGVPTGIGVNLTNKSTDVWVYMQGGGACWEGLTCFVLKSAVNIDNGYTAASFAAETDLTQLPGFKRTVAENPFKNANFVFVPYCTGDVHSGNKDTAIDSGGGAMKTMNFRGARNVEAFLRRLKLTFPNATKVYLTGSSAGAFGAELNYQRFVDAFPSAEVHVLADSGQMVNPSGSLLNDWISAWNIEVPATCTNCLTNFPNYVDWLATTFPNRRFALTAYSQDNVLRQFFNYDAANYQTQTELLLTGKYDPHANTKYFYLAGSMHTMLYSQFTITSPATSTPASNTLNDWVTAWYQGTGSWVSVKP